VEEPRWGTRYGHSIPSIIDIPFEGINRRIGGAFATDENNRVYLMHRDGSEEEKAASAKHFSSRITEENGKQLKMEIWYQDWY
jgi:hypothetical protein